MKFDEFAYKWIKDNPNDYSKITIISKRKLLSVHVSPFLGKIEFEDIKQKDIENIFNQVWVMSCCREYVYLCLSTLDEIFSAAVKEGIVKNNIVDYIHEPICLYYENCTNISVSSFPPFCAISFNFLSESGYKDVTYNLYLRYLKDYIHPFIGEKQIQDIKPGDIASILEFALNLKLCKDWVEQIERLLRSIFNYALDKGYIKSNPIDRLNLPIQKHLNIDIEEEKMKKIREIFHSYGLRKDLRPKIIKEIFLVLKGETFKEDKGVTFKQVFDKWYSKIDCSNYSANTLKAKRTSITGTANPCFGDITIKLIQNKDIVCLLNAYGLMGFTTYRQLIKSLKEIFNYAVEKGYIKDNPAINIKRNTITKRNKDIFNDEELNQFLLICEDAEYGYLYALIAMLGLRISEARGLRIDHIDLDNMTVLIDQQLLRRNKVSHTKTGSVRKIKLSNYGSLFIKKALAFKNAHRFKKGLGLLFVDENNDPISYHKIDKYLNTITRKLGRTDITPHSLRHVYLTIASRSNDSLVSIQHSAGHSTAGDVIKRYIHKNDESRNNACKLRQIYLEGLLNGKNNFGRNTSDA